MDLPFYHFIKERQEETVTYYFYSKVLQKEALKAVAFTPFDWANFYNVDLMDVV
ncbi:MAG: hypothetical protein ABIX01_11015 [Chitinophagaceae bacterium]